MELFMKYFVHPQFKFNLKNIFLIKWAFLAPLSKKVKKEIEKMFPQRFVYFTDMGRTAFKIILNELALKNCEIVMPSFTCDIFLPILKAYNLSPIFIETNKKTFNFNENELEKKITPKTKAILVSHTFGLACNLEKITQIAQKHNLKIIEDCSHGFGGAYQGKTLGLFGDASFFSLYKLFPCLRGGMVLLKKPISQPLKKTKFSLRDCFSLLNSFSSFSFIFKKLFQKQAKKHLRAEKTKKPAALNRVSFNLFAFSFKNETFLKQLLQQRKKTALELKRALEGLGFTCQPQENNSFTFLSCLCPKGIARDKLILNLRKKGIFATRIWREPIKTKPDFPLTLEISQRIINFPLQSFFQTKDTQRVIAKLKSLF
ncbi:aminotransferase class I/II-fold pyridoxal phosphate-dependent enzyme [Candidatus Parcubacteria bacterium]|nr:aminotransferase class I/II-fold pyridoxal phosphate-dependent enzyme [Candidatus Parcubacteria bacterium]